MKVLVYGAGVLGSYLAHILCQGGHDVVLLARGQRKQELDADGLIIDHALQRRTTVDRPQIVETAARQSWDAVFAVMQYQQMQTALEDLAVLDTPLVMLVGNNLTPAAMQQQIQARSPKEKTVVFGFQTTGGRKENGRIVSVHFGGSRLHCGMADAPMDAEIRLRIENIFQPTKLKLSIQPRMDAWYQSHLAMILPVAYLSYALGCDLTKATLRQVSMMMDAMREGFAALAAQGIPILPEGSDDGLQLGFKRTLYLLVYWILFKTPIGRLAASDHCKSAVTEMQLLEEAFDPMIGDKQQPIAMPNWVALRGKKPSWQALHQTYDVIG